MAAYGSDIGFNTWLSGQGITLPATAPSVSVIRAIGSAYVDGAYEPRLFCSKRTGGYNQDLAWPRTGAQFGSENLPDDLIPQPWINAAYRAGYLNVIKKGWATGGVDPSRMVKKQKAGQVEREFFGAGEGGVTGNAAAGFNVDPLIDGWLSVWLCDTASETGMFFMSIGT